MNYNDKIILFESVVLTCFLCLQQAPKIERMATSPVRSRTLVTSGKAQKLNQIHATAIRYGMSVCIEVVMPSSLYVCVYVKMDVCFDVHTDKYMYICIDACRHGVAYWNKCLPFHFSSPTHLRPTMLFSFSSSFWFIHQPFSSSLIVL